MRAIVLTSTQYSDNSFIVNLYTDEQGMVTVSVRASGRRSKFRRSYLLPLTILDIELTGRERADIRYVGDCTLAYSSKMLGTDPIKMLQAQFLAEMFHKSLRSGGADRVVFDFIRQSIIKLDSTEQESVNLHLNILVHLMSHIGIMPDLTGFGEGKVLDIAEGKMVYVSTGEYLSTELSECLVRVADSAQTTLSAHQRRDLIDFIVRYYHRHLAGFGSIKTLEVFRDMMA